MPQFFRNLRHKPQTFSVLSFKLQELRKFNFGLKEIVNLYLHALDEEQNVSSILQHNPYVCLLPDFFGFVSLVWLVYAMPKIL